MRVRNSVYRRPKCYVIKLPHDDGGAFFDEQILKTVCFTPPSYTTERERRRDAGWKQKQR